MEEEEYSGALPMVKLDTIRKKKSTVGPCPWCSWTLYGRRRVQGGVQTDPEQQLHESSTCCDLLRILVKDRKEQQGLETENTTMRAHDAPTSACLLGSSRTRQPICWLRVCKMPDDTKLSGLGSIPSKMLRPNPRSWKRELTTTAVTLHALVSHAVGGNALSCPTIAC